MNQAAFTRQAKTVTILPHTQGILQRKCACGNHKTADEECDECAKQKSGLQRKLSVGATNDPLEREADRVADQVIATPARSEVGCTAPRIQRYAGQASEGMDAAPDSVNSVLAGSGKPLEPALRNDMERRFGHDFSQVRVHSDQAAEQSASDVNARAYTVGRNVVFGAGQYQPTTLGGQRLIAHELTHVIQQQGQMNSPAKTYSKAIANPGQHLAQSIPDSGKFAQPMTLASPVLQRDQAEAEKKVSFAPFYPNCSPYERGRLDFQVAHAQGLVQIAIRDLGDEFKRASSKPGIISTTANALATQFHTHSPGHIRTVQQRFRLIHNRLQRGYRNWQCIRPASRCCEGSGHACAGPSTDVSLCPSHFEFGNVIGSLRLIHEAAHQAGLMRNTVRWEPAYAQLTTAQALTNADSYAMFARDNYYGGPIVSPLRPGSPAEQPHERESRAEDESRAWTNRYIEVFFRITTPPVTGAVGNMEDRRIVHVPPAQRRVGKHFRGSINFSMDTTRSSPLPQGHTHPEVSLRVTLHRSGSKRDRGQRLVNEVLLDDIDSRPKYLLQGVPLLPSFPTDFNFAFDPQDRGRLHIEASLQDFDTATTIGYKEDLGVRP